MDRLMKKRKVLRQRVAALLEECERKLSQACLTEDLHVLRDRLDKLKVNLNDVDNEIGERISKEEAENEFDEAIECSDRIEACLSKLSFRLKKTERQETSIDREQKPRCEPGTSKKNVKLPKMELTKFNGQRKNWQQFWEQFEQVIHQNDDITDVDKFNYLKSCVTGEAATAILALPQTSRCYHDAVELLKQRFGDEELLVQTHMRQLIDLKEVHSSDDIKGLRRILDTVLTNVRGLETLGRKEETYSNLLYPVVQRALPKELLLDFNRKLVVETNSTLPGTSEDDGDNQRSSDGMVTTRFRKLIDFLRIEVQSRENLEVIQSLDNKPKHQGTFKGKWKRNENKNKYSAAVLQQSTVVTDKCFFCNDSEHATINCNADIPLEEKKKRLRAARRCFRCTKVNHQAKVCRGNAKCGRCSGRHATVMCDPEYTKRKTDNVTSVPVNLQSITGRKKTVLLPTVTVTCFANLGETQVRALFDSGSQRSFITTETANVIGCKTVGEEKLTVGAFGGHDSERILKRVQVSLKTQDGQTRKIEALRIDTICTQTLPSPVTALGDQLSELSCQVGDTTDRGGPKKIGLLIGSEHCWELLTGQSKKIGEKLRALETVFGWTVQGPVEGDGHDTLCSQVVALKATVMETTTSDILTRFWMLESIGIKDGGEDHNEQHPTTEFFENTITKTQERYEVALPWKTKIDLPDNKDVATRRLQQLTRRLEKSPDLFKAYDNVVQGYLSNDMAELVEDNQEDQRLIYYMPHQAVIREESSTTKLRVVFDASSHKQGARSLNENLESGPNLTSDLVSLLLNFRNHRVALVADIEKAFLQIQVRECDRNALRFLWYERIPETGEATPDIKTYRMKRVPFGTTASPFLLAATIRHHLNGMEHKYPETIPVLKDSFYVDDLLVGADTYEEAVKLYKEANEIFADASMKLHKWASNSDTLRQQFETDSSSVKSVGFIAGILKVLGLVWDPVSDELTFSVDLKNQQLEEQTKRIMLQTTARLYDPLGWISPFTVRAKVLFQKLWRINIDWDDILPEDINDEWRNWCSEMETLRQIHISRFYGDAIEGRSEKRTLHVFADASTAAYGAVAYLTITDYYGQCASTILISKSRIAPIKPQTLARLELMACLIAARLHKYIRENTRIAFDEVHCWTDSMIALHWIRSDPGRWKQFVRNRVAEIQRHTDSIVWQHCPGKDNPADLVTRGMAADKLINCDRWWCGPDWLRMPKENWPHAGEADYPFSHEELEEKTTTQVLQSADSPCSPEPLIEIQRFSSAAKLMRITAWVMRIVGNLRRSDKQSGHLNASEIERAELYWAKYVQMESFSAEIKCIQKKKKFPPNSPLRSLSLFIDDNGLLRIGGRLQFAEKDYNERHPIVLPKGHHLSRLLAEQSHRQVLHGGARDTLVQLRERYWVVGARQLVKRVIKECITCQRFNSRPAGEIAPPIPSDRVTEALPFEVTGVDFAGPLLVKGKTATSKAYIALFTCAVTRAVHLELVGDMTSKTFLLALRRFVSRRGLPRVMYSDNALTFKRTNKDLRTLWEATRKQNVTDYISGMKIQWKFIMERAPWWGGFYERLVGSTKLALKKTLGTRYLTADELATTLCEVEAVLNSRPITHLYDEQREPEPLCPAFFLTGRRLTTLPNLKRNEINEMQSHQLQQAWDKRQRALASFWRRWSKEYLAELKSAADKNGKSRTVKNGDLVLLRESMQPRQQWKIARVEATFPGTDGRVRSCIIRIPGGNTLKRPIQLLYPLEING